MMSGSGRPVARGPHLAEVFSWAHEEDFLCGRVHRLRRGPLWVGLLGSLFFAGLVLLFMQLTRHRPELLVLEGALGALVVVPLFAKVVVDFTRLRRLERADLYVGEIIACSGESNHRRVFEVQVAWRARLPDGTLLEGTSGFDRNDLKSERGKMPVPGAPVAILVRSPNEWLVL